MLKIQLPLSISFLEYFYGVGISGIDCFTTLINIIGTELILLLLSRKECVLHTQKSAHRKLKYSLV